MSYSLCLLLCVVIAMVCQATDPSERIFASWGLNSLHLRRARTSRNTPSGCAHSSDGAALAAWPAAGSQSESTIESTCRQQHWRRCSYGCLPVQTCKFFPGFVQRYAMQRGACCHGGKMAVGSHW